MTKTARLLLIALLAATHAGASAASQDLTDAIELLKQMHTDECKKQKLRGQLLIAHQSHDQAKMTALAPQLDAVNDRLKPSEAKLKTLKERISQDQAEKNAFESAQLEMGECD